MSKNSVYAVGEYCSDVACEFYRDGTFCAECDTCDAYTFYLWLMKHGYTIIKPVPSVWEEIRWWLYNLAFRLFGQTKHWSAIAKIMWG